MKKVLFLLLLISSKIMATDCQRPALDFSCDYYRECLETELNCGETGYPLNYGEKYCTKFYALDFLDPNKQLSPKGNIWREETGKCLQIELQEGLVNNTFNTCKQLTKFAFKTHPKCYTQKNSSICDLPIHDWKIIINIPEKKDLLSPRGGKHMLAVMVKCTLEIIAQIPNAHSSKKEELHEKLNFLKKYKDGLF